MKKNFSNFNEDYEYFGSGTLITYGRPSVAVHHIYARFSVGSTVYDAISARNGVLEPVTIRKIILNRKYDTIIPLYVDTLNGWYGEANLMTLAEAEEAVEVGRRRTSNGTADGVVDQVFHARFAVGSTVYDAISAHNGVLEPVTIRKIVLNNKFNVIIPLYIDTLNGWYGEANLMTLAEAEEAAGNYRQRKLAIADEIDDLLRECRI